MIVDIFIGKDDCMCFNERSKDMKISFRFGPNGLPDRPMSFRVVQGCSEKGRKCRRVEVELQMRGW